MYFGGGKKIGERDSMARLTRKNSFSRICYYFYARERDEKDAPIAGFFNFSMGQFLLLLLLPTRYPGNVCVSYEEKENSRVNFFFNRSYFGACFSIFTLTV